MANRVMSSGSYDEALSIMCEYIEPVSQYDRDIYDDYDYEDISI